MQSKLKIVDGYVWDNECLLGEGAFGKVYKCQKQNKQFAVKVIKKTTLQTSQIQLETLENEIEVMKKFTKSNNILKYISHYSDDQNYYIFTEYCEGGNLRTYIQRRGGYLQENQSIEILNQLINGFKDLIKNGYLHRDIKLENCLIKQNTFILSDFGLATKYDLKGYKLIKQQVGTPLYMSPQLLENYPYTTKGDIWSLGMLFYEMLFGKTPWNCKNLSSFLYEIKNKPLLFPLNIPIKQETRDFLMKCLSIDEGRRMTWEEIFSHEMIQSQRKKIKLDEKSKSILFDLQKIVFFNKINIKKILFDKQKNLIFQINQAFLNFQNKQIIQFLKKIPTFFFKQFHSKIKQFQFQIYQIFLVKIINKISIIIKIIKQN
ncbi:protein kinase domain protein [Ichthyophthirius multifiliis]|uniref:Protein kinase domain protein n=1 Tax=Ichthyophthirius multifiliis TaxID=5932 RepID=G0QU16_ICHMU|nr:protein kinase domain protein [Ichthyophthirius multifiliis]EGR31283.1 protein kinase domain protein [Ichthyophthirius multifiliis]|eukprot:XP_004034769.1 protein kinase domain protein [Ichthyophthirius multifiliis]